MAHPALEKSRVHRRLNRIVGKLEGITFRDLYETYPTFDIQVETEKALLAQHDLVIFQHPFYWYSGPALLKQWQDLVLEHGWAYGTNGTALKGKYLMNAISTGGPYNAYQLDGHHQHTLQQFLLPFEQTAKLCNMIYLPPFAVTGAHRMTDAEIDVYATQYKQLLEYLQNSPFDLNTVKKLDTLNHLLKTLPQAK